MIWIAVSVFRTATAKPDCKPASVAKPSAIVRMRVGMMAPVSF